MKFSIQREQLLKPLQFIIGVVERRQTLPILSNILLSIEGDSLTLTATDLEVEIKANTNLNVEEGGTTTIPARKFVDICKALPEGVQINFTHDNEKARMNIRSGKSRFNLATLAPDGFPKIDEIDASFKFSLTQKALRDLISHVGFCMAQQDVRYYLNGMLLEIDKGLVKSVATDGHRLAYCEKASDVNPDKNVQLILPRKGVNELLKLLEQDDEQANIMVGKNHLSVKLANVEFTTKLVDGRFPDYDRVIPSVTDRSLMADKSLICDALSRASILSNEKYRGIRLIIKNNTLQAQAHNPEMEEAEEEIEIQYQGEELEIGFNVTYLLDAISHVETSEVLINFGDSNSSCLISQETDSYQCKYVVMPMRL